MPSMIGKTMGGYKVVEKIGAGGMGEVYRAHDAKLQRDVALKVLPEAFVADPERMARFQREARTLASLNHPHIASLYDLEETDGIPFLVMELVEGEDLSERLALGAIPQEEACAVAPKATEAFSLNDFIVDDRGIADRNRFLC